jgi:hypothetical protein
MFKFLIFKKWKSEVTVYNKTTKNNYLGIFRFIIINRKIKIIKYVLLK